MNNLVLMTDFVMGKMRRIFFMSYPENRIDYKNSRIRYTVADSMAQTIAQLSGGTFLVMLMEQLGISDGNKGIIASFGCIAAVMQLISMKLASKIKKNKLMVCLTVLQRLWLSFIFFIPLMQIQERNARVLMIACYCFTQLAVQLGTPASVDWIAALTPEKVRGRYFAKKDSMAVLVIIISTLIMGVVVDAAEKYNPMIGFVAVGAVIGIMAVISAAAFAGMKEPKLSCTDDEGKELTGSLAHKKHLQEKEKGTGAKAKISILSELKTACRSKPFRRVLLLNGLWVTGFYLASPFNASYQVKDLQLPYTYIMVLSFVTNIVRIYLAPKAGKWADRAGMAKVMKWAFGAMLAHFLVMACSVPSNAYVTAAVAALCSALGWTFVGTGMLGMQLESFPQEKRIEQYALFSVISGIYGFLVSIVAGKLIDWLQAQSLTFGGKQIYAQQITNLSGCLFVAITIVYLTVIIGKKSK